MTKIQNKHGHALNAKKLLGRVDIDIVAMIVVKSKITAAESALLDGLSDYQASQINIFNYFLTCKIILT